MISRHTLAFVLLAAAAIASFFLLSDEEKDGQSATAGDVPDGYYLRDAQLTGTDDQGAVAYTLRAARAEQVRATDSVALQTIDLSYGSGDEALALRAARGSLSNVEQSLQLSGGVVIETRQEPPATLLTEAIEVSFRDKTAYTDLPVELQFGGGVLTAVGLRADLEAQTWQLDSDVSGRFGDARERTP